MDQKQLEKMEQWHIVAKLMGVDAETIYHNDYAEPEDDFLHLLEQHEDHLRRIANPSELFAVVLRTMEMGVSMEEIHDYTSYLDDLEIQKALDERNARIAGNPALRSLIDDYSYEVIESKQYPKHRNFKFKNRAGLEITGRIFNPRWARARVWLSWRDNKNKLHRQQLQVSMADSCSKYPDSFPEEWINDGWNKTTLNPERLSFVIAHKIIHRSMGKDFTYPKAKQPKVST
jgi:hypothetical protein